MKNFSFKARMIYFGLITVVSFSFFAMQGYANSTGSYGTGSIVLLILWGMMIAFGIAGMIYSIKNRNPHKK